MKTTKQKQKMTYQECYEMERNELKEETCFMKDLSWYLEACLINQSRDKCLVLIKRQSEPLKFLIDIINHINDKYPLLWSDRTVKEIIYLSIEEAIKCKIGKIVGKKIEFYNYAIIINDMMKDIYNNIFNNNYDCQKELESKVIENINWNNVAKTQKLSDEFIKHIEDYLKNQEFLEYLENQEREFFNDKMNESCNEDAAAVEKISENDRKVINTLHKLSVYIWNQISTNPAILTDAILREFKDELRWDFVSMYIHFDEKDIDKYKEFIDYLNLDTFFTYHKSNYSPKTMGEILSFSKSAIIENYIDKYESPSDQKLFELGFFNNGNNKYE